MNGKDYEKNERFFLLLKQMITFLQVNKLRSTFTAILEKCDYITTPCLRTAMENIHFAWMVPLQVKAHSGNGPFLNGVCTIIFTLLVADVI